MRKIQEVFSRSEAEQCWQAIKEAESFALLGHKDPDRDAIYSCLAMAEVLSGLGKKIQIIFPNRPNFKITSPHAPVLAGRHAFIPDVVMVFDTGVRSRCYIPREFESQKIINIDHHMGNVIEGAFNFVDTGASSACEALARLMLIWGGEEIITPSVSQKLMVGILDDSIVFKTAQSGASALDTATKLIELGADFGKAKKLVASYRTPEMVKIWAGLISEGVFHEDKSLFVIGVDAKRAKDGGFKISNLEGLVNFVSNVINCDVVALVREVERNQIKGSLRSKARDVREVAGKLGGGGHKNAAGFSMPGTVDKVVQDLLKAFG